MNNNSRKLLLPLLVVSSLALAGCGEKKQCEIPTSHVHKYTKNVTRNITISKYLNEEYASYWGYEWNPEYIETTKDDEKFYQCCSNLFQATDNWDYLYYLMKKNHDFLDFYYHYTTLETYIVTDSNGKDQVRTRTVVHSGWTDNPNYSHNTGEVRLGHYRYYSYYIERSNDRYKIVKSPLVDDIREVLEDYPYTEENCCDIVYEYFKFRERQLPFLTTDDFHVFDHPDFSNTSMELHSDNKVLKK